MVVLKGVLRDVLRGEINKAKKIASDMKKKGLEFSLISELTGFTEDEIQSL